MKERKILAINPGSTSTKIAVFRNRKSIFIKKITHDCEELLQFKRIIDQLDLRKQLILDELKMADLDILQVDAVIGRGGLVKPISSGIYRVNERLKEDLRIGIMGEHASNLGGLIADQIASLIPGAQAFIADPVVVDEMEEIARISGHPKFVRKSIFHALNHKATAQALAKAQEKKYEEMNLIIAHLGGGISVGAHRRGRVVDVNQALNGEGPFSPERSGTLPVGDLVDYCFKDKANHARIKRMITGRGGLVAYMGTNDAYEVEQKAQAGDPQAQLIQSAMAYQVAKEIGAMATVLEGKVDSIILTGGIAHNHVLVDKIKEMTSFIAPIVVFPGEDEMSALAMNAYGVLTGELTPKIYK